MRALFIVLVALALPAVTAIAQGIPEDAMEAQRCIWRCGHETGRKNPAYDQCILRECNDAPNGRKPAPVSSTKPSAQPGAPGWIFGDHPVLGRSAHIETSDGAIGLACAYFGDSVAMTHVLALRVTPGLAHDNQLAVVFDPTFRSGGVTLQSKGAYLEHPDDTCSVFLDDFKRSRSLLIVDGTYGGFDYTNGNNAITVVQDGRKTELHSVDEVRQKLRFRTFPLDGSGAAINRLIASCKAAQRDIKYNCGRD